MKNEMSLFGAVVLVASMWVIGTWLGGCGGNVEARSEQASPMPSATVQPVEDARSEAASEQDAGQDNAKPETAPETGADSGCTPVLTERYTGPADGTAAAGTQGLDIMDMEYEASDCADIPIGGFAMFLDSPDATVFCKEPCQAAEDWNLRNARIMNGDVSVWGTSQFAMEGNPASPLVRFQDPNLPELTIKAGTKVKLRLVVDVAPNEVVPGSLYGKRFRGYPFTFGFDFGVEFKPDTPDKIGFQTIEQPPAQAGYCSPVTTQAEEEFGYWGCCGTFKQQFAPSVGYLFKGSEKAVYYMAYDGKRYVFPTSVILDSWYSQKFVDGVPQRDDSICNQVVEIPDDAVAAILIGGNVTLRPGAYVTGITTDPKRYVISKGHVLHWLESDAIGEQIYPGTYQARIRRVPDAFFVNFVVGMSYPYGGQYDLAAALAVTLEQDLGIAP